MYMYSARFNNAGVNIKAMKVMPGHRNIDTAMQICSDAIERYEGMHELELPKKGINKRGCNA